MEKQQYINECHLEVNPTFGQVQAGILRKWVDVVVHRWQPIERSE